jgi:hypothetical protein
MSNSTPLTADLKTPTSFDNICQLGQYFKWPISPQLGHSYVFCQCLLWAEAAVKFIIE